jgi:hypothetical protein
MFSSCAKKKAKIPDHIIPIREFSNIITDIRLAESNNKLAVRGGQGSNNLLDSSYQLIFNIHQVKAQNVDSSFRWYAKHPDYQQEIDNYVLENLNRLQ